MAETLREQDLYDPIKTKLHSLMATEFPEFHLEITANRRFGNELKSRIPQHQDIIFHFLREAAPDITGFVQQQYSVDFVVVEIKKEAIKLDDIYQTRKYAELFGAKYALLVSTQDIPEELRRLWRVNYFLLALPAYKTLTLVQYDTRTGFVDWFPTNPFIEG